MLLIYSWVCSCQRGQPIIIRSRGMGTRLEGGREEGREDGMKGEASGYDSSLSSAYLYSDGTKCQVS